MRNTNQAKHNKRDPVGLFFILLLYTLYFHQLNM